MTPLWWVPGPTQWSDWPCPAPHQSSQPSVELPLRLTPPLLHSTVWSPHCPPVLPSTLFSAPQRIQPHLIRSLPHQKSCNALAKSKCSGHPHSPGWPEHSLLAQPHPPRPRALGHLIEFSKAPPTHVGVLPTLYTEPLSTVLFLMCNKESQINTCLNW